ARELSMPATQSIWDRLRTRDVMLHHPFDSYKSVVAFIDAAADDPAVLSIKQTLYRTNEDSPILQALLRAAGNKEVVVVVELKARFDEASNIRWARQLEDAGVQVFHGLVGLKTHCKLSLMVRKDEDGATRRYAHLGTGNYNPATAKFYTDLSLLTADPALTGAAHDVFNFLTSYAERSHYEPLIVSPLNLAERTVELIGREAEHARQGRPAHIIAKMNALLDQSVIQELYRASQAGVTVDLIVRGMCALRPGVRRVSSRIRVRSVVGRFLEHSRIFYFANGGGEEIYLSSADWMPRNLYERVEVMFPLQDPILRTRVRDEILAAYLADNSKARRLRADGEWSRADGANAGPRRAPGKFSAQEFLVDVAEGRATAADIPTAAARRKPARFTDRAERVAAR